MRGASAFVLGLTIAAVVSTASAVPACDVCTMHLTHRTGPYRIVVTREGAWPGKETWLGKKAPQIRVTIVNPGPRPIVLGDTPAAARLTLNSVMPYGKGRQPIRVAPPGRTKTVPAGSRVTLHTQYPYLQGRPGVYRFNVSYGAVDSNMLTYTVK